ncbi:MAG: hypothetical protein LUC92_03520 [Clostridiales bacterium]|nr:hypothetical protein [Clostridiales bacterium]
MRIIGKIDINIYKCIAEDIVTDEVVLADKQILHIKERHPNDYEQFAEYFPDIIADPDNIIKGNKPKTALILKEIVDNGELFKTILRLITSTDENRYKNSIITFMKIDKKEWNRLPRYK